MVAQAFSEFVVKSHHHLERTCHSLLEFNTYQKLIFAVIYVFHPQIYGNQGRYNLNLKNFVTVYALKIGEAGWQVIDIDLLMNNKSSINCTCLDKDNIFRDLLNTIISFNSSSAFTIPSWFDFTVLIAAVIIVEVSIVTGSLKSCPITTNLVAGNNTLATKGKGQSFITCFTGSTLKQTSAGNTIFSTPGTGSSIQEISWFANSFLCTISISEGERNVSTLHAFSSPGTDAFTATLITSFTFILSSFKVSKVALAFLSVIFGVKGALYTFSINPEETSLTNALNTVPAFILWAWLALPIDNKLIVILALTSKLGLIPLGFRRANRLFLTFLIFQIVALVANTNSIRIWGCVILASRYALVSLLFPSSIAHTLLVIWGWRGVNWAVLATSLVGDESSII